MDPTPLEIDEDSGPQLSNVDKDFIPELTAAGPVRTPHCRTEVSILQAGWGLAFDADADADAFCCSLDVILMLTLAKRDRQVASDDSSFRNSLLPLLARRSFKRHQYKASTLQT